MADNVRRFKASEYTVSNGGAWMSERNCVLAADHDRLMAAKDALLKEANRHAEMIAKLALDERVELQGQLAERTSERDEALAERDECRALYDAFMAGQEASLNGKPRESNPYPPGDSYGVNNLWSQWDDGYDCNINRALKADLAALWAEHEALKAMMPTSQRVLLMKLRAAEADAQALREALKRYGMHERGCQYAADECVCGLLDAMAPQPR